MGLADYMADPPSIGAPKLGKVIAVSKSDEQQKIN